MFKRLIQSRTNLREKINRKDAHYTRRRIISGHAAHRWKAAEILRTLAQLPRCEFA